ncbi:FAD-linked oxidoreductase [Clavulina sp. PMI_390]|nr:FAD-linked oxidoreductase [Clavulina sp. PMI_390]
MPVVDQFCESDSRPDVTRGNLFLGVLARQSRLRSSGPWSRARYQSTSPPRSALKTPTFVGVGAGVVGLGVLSYLAAPTYLEAPLHKSRTDSDTDPDESLLSLLRSYVVYTTCAIPALVDSAPTILSTLDAIPVVNRISQSVIRHTFFDHFVGGESAAETFPILDKLRRQGTGTLLAYSVEVHEEGGEAQHGSHDSQPIPPHKQHMAEVVRSIDAAAQFEEQNLTRGFAPSKTWTAVKLTALLPDAGSIERLSMYICETQSAAAKAVPFPHTPSSKDLVALSMKTPPTPLTTEDIADIKEMYGDLRSICILAKQKNVTLIFDAEHSWYTPAIDAIVLALTREFNRPTSPRSSSFFFSSASTASRPNTPLIYGTYQSYLRRGVPHLQACLEDAKREGYMIGVKLVRGAYQGLEKSVWEKRVTTGGWIGGSGDVETHPPVWTEKKDTDDTYNKSAALLVHTLRNDRLKGDVPTLGVLFGTHNHESCELIMRLLKENGLAKPVSGEGASQVLRLDDQYASRFTFGQLYGMRDDLTSMIASRLQASMPVTLKYVPYGSLEDVIPYLARRAIENKSVLGANGGGGDSGATAERKQVGARLRRKIFGYFGIVGSN